MFLMVPVTPWAYSGLAMSSASAATIRACNATTGEGNNSSRSGLKSGNSPAPQRRLICTSGGAKRAAARRSAELIEEALRLPEIARTLMTPNDGAERRAVIDRCQAIALSHPVNAYVVQSRTSAPAGGQAAFAMLSHSTCAGLSHSLSFTGP